MEVHVPKENVFPNPASSTMTSSDGQIRHWTYFQESHINGYWNVDGGGLILECHYTYAKTVAWERFSEVQATSSPEYLWSKVWSSLPKSFHQKKNIHWNLARPAKIYSGIILRQGLIVRKQMVLQTGQYPRYICDIFAIWPG